MSWLQIIIYVLIALYILTVASVVFNVILENRNPVRTLAWIIVLVTVPLVGFLFYLYFGVNYRKNKMFSMKGLGDMKWLQYMSEDQKQLIRKSEFLKKRETVEVRKLMTLLLNNSKALLTRYNQVEILNNGEETFPALFGALKNAKKFIHLEYYIIGEGRLATELKEILLQKAAEGVEIRIIYDDVGSWSLSKEFIRELRKSDIQIYPFLPVRFHHLANKANYRNHRKIAVVDGEVGFVGGLNIADRYMDGVPGIGIWRDTHLKVTGEVVTSLQVIFLIDWYFVRQELLLDKNEYLPYHQALPISNDARTALSVQSCVLWLRKNTVSQRNSRKKNAQGKSLGGRRRMRGPGCQHSGRRTASPPGNAANDRGVYQTQKICLHVHKRTSAPRENRPIQTEQISVFGHTP